MPSQSGNLGLKQACSLLAYVPDIEIKIYWSHQCLMLHDHTKQLTIYDNYGQGIYNFRNILESICYAYIWGFLESGGHGF